MSFDLRMIYERTDAEYQEIFNESDRDGDGYVTEEELCAVLQLKFENNNFNMRLFHQFFLQFDTDDDGRLDFKGILIIKLEKH